MNAKGTLETKPVIESARLEKIGDPEASCKGGSGPERSHRRRLWKRKWARRIRRPSLTAAYVENVRLLSVGEEERAGRAHQNG